MLELLHVSRAFEGRPTVRDVTLLAEARRTTVLVGPSGSGKSTLVRLMAGLIWPDSGEVRIEGEPLTPANAGAVRRRMGYVIQEGGLFPHLTAGENVALMPRYLGQARGDIERRVRELADMVHLPADVLDRYPVQLSGGQRQRVGLMRALVLDPHVLLLDEPLGALDPLVRYELQNELRQLFADLGKTVILVTHDVGEAAFLGDYLVVLRDGAVVQAGTVERLLRHPADPFVERFLSLQRRLPVEHSS